MQFRNEKTGHLSNVPWSKDETYRDRVKIVKEQLLRAINNSSPDNLYQGILGLPRGIRRAFGGE